MNNFYEPKTQKGLFGNIALWVIGLVVLFSLIGAGLWGLGVFTSNIKGAGGAIKQKNSTVNRVQKQEMFVELNEDFTGYLAKIKVNRQALTAASSGTPEEKQIAQDNLTGVVQQCIDTAQQYNAESQKYTSRVWKSTGLPYRLDLEECTSS